MNDLCLRDYAYERHMHFITSFRWNTNGIFHMWLFLDFNISLLFSEEYCISVYDVYE